jgi:hypothetical protein
VAKHDKGEDLQSPFMPDGVETLQERLGAVASRQGRNGGCQIHAFLSGLETAALHEY